jgi:hypothetical protein
MKSFAMKEMWKFSQFQLKEMFGYGKKKAFIQLLFLRSFSISPQIEIKLLTDSFR